MALATSATLAGEKRWSRAQRRDRPECKSSIHPPMRLRWPVAAAIVLDIRAMIQGCGNVRIYHSMTALCRP